MTILPLRRPAALLLALFLLAAPSARAGKRNPTAAFGLALVPGALVHGSGHYYAGEKKTASILFLAEVFGLALMSLDHPKGGLDQRIGDREQSPLQSGDLSTLGRALFFGSWLYDVGGSGDATRRFNDRQLRGGLELGFEPVDEGRRVSFNPRAAYTVRF